MTAVACVALMAVAAADPTKVTSPAPIRKAAARPEPGSPGAFGGTGYDHGVATLCTCGLEPRARKGRAAKARAG